MVQAYKSTFIALLDEQLAVATAVARQTIRISNRQADMYGLLPHQVTSQE
jgi:hypothetical protein